jgi:chromosome segregation ATPase
LNSKVTIAGMALVFLGIFIPLIGWFLILPFGLIVIVAGLIMTEEAKAVSVESAPAPRSIEEVLLDADLVTAEMEAIARKIMEFRNLKETLESIDRYLGCLKDAKSKINTAGNIESSIVQILKEINSRLSATEAKIADLEKSKNIYGVQRESLDLKISQAKVEWEGLKADVAKYENILKELRSKRDTLTDLLNKELGSETIETIEPYLKTIVMYREKYGEKAEKKFQKNLSVLMKIGMSRKDALERLFNEVKR